MMKKQLFILIKIEEIRIDKLIKGHSYKINDEILELINGCGLSAADLSLGNKNVYHEIGYLMGMNKGKNQQQNNFILILNSKTSKADFNKDVCFNVNHHSVLTCDGTNQIREKSKEQIAQYYGLS